MDMKMTHETISAFTDGELRSGAVDTVLTDLRAAEGRAAWDLYQKIGDVLRSDETGVTFRPGFETRLFARLDAEPTILMPSIAAAVAGIPVRGEPDRAIHNGVGIGSATGASANVTSFDVKPTKRSLRRFAMPGAAAAAVAAFAFMATPQLMVALTSSPASLAGMVKPDSRMAGADIKLVASSGASAGVAGEAQHGDVMRDPGLDEYLMAHQRFSPSVYSTAQFARSSTFVTETGK